MDELEEAYKSKLIPDGSTLTLEMVDEVLTRMALLLEELE